MGKSALELNGDGDGYGYGDGSGSGDGYGSGSGDGYGDGYGYGYGDGYGYGYGDGSGSGDGYGYGSGYGSGSGDGDGDGYGYGYGYGDGYGYGSGYGSGDGDGYGYGDGSGSGDGYGYGSGYERQKYLNVILSPHQRGADKKIMFWRSHNDGTPSNGGSGTKARIGLMEVVTGPLSICTRNALHGTSDPTKWRGDHWWIVALHEPVVFDGDKGGSLKRTILADLGRCPF